MANALLNLYLLAFNAASCAGWAYVLFLTVSTVQKSYEAGQDWDKVAQATWDVVALPLQVVQTMAVMEIVHAAVGFVRSPLGSTLMQVSSRLWLVWGINVLCPVSRYQFGFPLMVASWGLVEVPRYSFYALNLYDKVPSFLFFLRYHLFMVLYPSGVLGETLCMVSSLSFLSTGAYAIQLPNTHNIALSLYVVVILVLIVYIPGLPVMYGHMLTQRNRAYAKIKTKSD
ncbi:Very-long-chain (3R)-3-hydroxyacyl-CoA dehydratase PASTICCINO 2 [Phytophthora boehmeriae]|uniref:very-long-chain (3R)-3-hydroxyacyl-CoA dehydratase n=1 Tax=Phytophthora boehmeriae TaxID=109152 RepID=A0A8T1WT85_9STRA|nr:Very-long-chain (3R)-3-hydroxyacyl-CoA dehydratase PASTICCINO 2 [Phytophthora boehmeriae]